MELLIQKMNTLILPIKKGAQYIMSQNELSFVDIVYNKEPYNGLTSKEASEKLNQFGENILKTKKVSGYKIFFRQFINPFTFILGLAAVLSFIFGEYDDAGIIIGIVMLNSILSFIQEYKSEKAIDKLGNLIEHRCIVIRDNKHKIIETFEIVIDDLLILKHGDVVPADAKIIDSYDLFVNESQLTGESIPVSKGTFLQGDSNKVYAGSVVEKGSCKCIVCATGYNTKLGKIALLSQETDEDTPYEKSLNQFSKQLMLIAGVIVFSMMIIKAFTVINFNEFVEAIVFSIALAMAVIPEALPMIITTNLSHGAIKLSKQKVVTKRLSSIEDLGRINLLCTDKTGTLTQDNLIISSIVSQNEPLFAHLITGSLEKHDIDKQYINSFDSAFYNYIISYGGQNIENWVHILNSPFNPSLRRRRVISKNIKDNKLYLIVVGAPEELIEISNNVTNYYKENLEESAKKGMRQLAIAYKELEEFKDYNIDDEEKDLNFVGFANLHDPIRVTAKSTIAEARKMDIDVKILSGDSVEVAKYVGEEIGLINKNDKIYTGNELEKMNNEDFSRILNSHSVFARVTPEQKYNIIKELKKNNVVGFQGDGINDAPSLKLADVSIAVSGATEVAKESADIVLLEDDLSVIINAIEYGRSIFVNINKYIKHALVGNLGNLFSMAIFYILFAAEIPMLAIQLLIGNIIQDMPLMTVFSDSVDNYEINKPQKASKIKSIMKTSISLGVFTAIYYLMFFLFVGTKSTPLTQTTLFIFYNFTQLLVIVSIRNEKQFFWQGVKPSQLLLRTIIIFMIISTALIYIPFTANIMGFVPITFNNFIFCLLISILYLFLLDFVKIGLNKLNTLEEDI